MSWTPVVDISRHQGAINFNTMRSKGVPFLIIRISHGATMDSRAIQYYEAALEAGYKPQDIGFYSFINPKRGTGKFTAEATASMIRNVCGRTDVLYMPDVESYTKEPPDIGLAPVRGAEFALYLRSHIAAFKAQMSGCYIIMYSNYAFWNSSLGPQDSQLASQYEWLVPRYPLYSDLAYQRRGYPPEPNQWDEYAFGLAEGPYPPAGASGWEGWQFSAGYNRQGPVYGCAEPDLDLNIVESGAAQRWFSLRTAAPEPEPTPEPPFVPDPSPIELEYTEMTAINGQRIWSGILRKGVSRIEVPQVPDEATGVEVCLTFRGSLAPGFATLWDGASEIVPTVSQINWKTTATDADIRNGNTPVKLLNKGFSIYCEAEVNMIIDLVGYEAPVPPAAPTVVQIDEVRVRQIVADAIANG
jgi:hypothetical protein